MRSLVLALLLIACTPQPIAGSSVSGASVVTLVRPELGRDANGLPTVPRYSPYCNAFAIRESLAVWLVTANHCAPGAVVRYLAPNGVGHSKADVARRDAARDIAWLAPDDATGLVPLAAAREPAVGDPAVSVSSVFGEVAFGVVTDRHLAAGRYSTSHRIKRGWSGSPMLDIAGQVWGVVVACPARPASALEGDVACVTGAIAAGLE